MCIVVGEVVVVGPFLPHSLLAEVTARLRAEFWRDGGKGRLVVQLRAGSVSVASYEIWIAYLETTSGTLDVRHQVSAALGLPSGAFRPN